MYIEPLAFLLLIKTGKQRTGKCTISRLHADFNSSNGKLIRFELAS